jgi:PPOX class probable F420-dependent enzyme
MELPKELLRLLRKPSLCYVATTMPDGSPQVTQTWVDTDGAHILVNSVRGFRKIKNIERDPRITLAVSDPANLTRYYEIRGRVLAVTTDGAVEHIDKLAHKYTGQPYAWYGGRDQVRLIVTIEAERIIVTGD